MHKARLHVIAGISGTGVQQALKKLSGYAAARGHKNFGGFVSLEEKLRALGAPAVREVYGFKDPGLLAVFLLPRDYLRALWAQALDAAFVEVNERLKQGLDTILTLHLCYFHHGYREYLVPANFDDIRNRIDGRAAGLITLIDDVYDSLTRLARPRQILDPPTSHERAFADALSVLHWRAGELLVADGLAASCGIPHFVFATKHPVETFHDLLYSNKPRAYISHPISEVRRMRKAGRQLDAQVLLNELQRLGGQLASEFVLFEPTAIDEARFLFEESATHPIRHSGNLTERWPFVGDARPLLWEQPPDLGNQYAFPVGWQPDRRDPILDSPVIEETRQVILRQIGARDHWLVEQSDFLVCFRPLFEGHASSGVREELRHLARLRKLDVHTALQFAAVVCPPSDRAAFPRRIAWQRILPEKYREGTLLGSEDSLSRLQEAIRTLPDAQLGAALEGGAAALQELLGRFQLTLRPLGDDDLPEGALGTSEQVRRDLRAQKLAELLRQSGAPYLDELRQMSVISEYQDIDSACEALRARFPRKDTN